MRFRLSTSAIGPWLLACGCGLALLLAIWVRFLPAESAGCPLVLRADSAFHLRMLSYIIESGGLPEQDPLFYREPPRVIAHTYPPNLYLTASAVFQTARRMTPGPVDFRWIFFFFNALCGALPVAGCGWAIWEVSGGKRLETFLGMVLCAIASPMVLRSHAGIFRHETVAVGLLLLFTCILLHGIRQGSRPFWNWMAAICMFAGMGFWRLFPFLAALIMLGVLAAEFFSQDSCRLGSLMSASALGCLSAAVGYTFYRSALPAAVFYFLPVMALPVLHWLAHRPLASQWREKLIFKRWGLLAAAMVLILAGSLAVPMIRVRWQATISSSPLPLTSATLYGLLVEELEPLPLNEAFSSGFFLYLPILLIAAVCLMRRRWEPVPSYRAAWAVFLIFITLTVFFVRFVFLSFPFLIICLVPPLCRALDELNIKRACLASRAIQAAIIIALLGPALGLYLWEDLRLARYLLLPDRDQVAAYEWLKTNVPPDANVISDWSHGFEIQTFAGRRTVMDGYLEDGENRNRILGLLRVLLSTDEAELVRYMRQQNGNYLLLDRAYLFPTCRRFNLPWPGWFEIQEHERYSRLSLKPARERNNYLKCLFDPTNLKSFKVVFNSGNYIVLRLEPAN